MIHTVLEHLCPLFTMGVIVFGSQALARRFQNDRQRDESQRLRSALTISLTALRKLYESNLGVLAGQKPPLISGRTQIVLLRLHFGRLMSLDQPEIESLWAASIAVEELETAMAVAGKTVGGVAFTLPEAHEAREALKSALMQACSRLETAESLMAVAGKRSELQSSKDHAEFGSLRRWLAARQRLGSSQATQRERKLCPANLPGELCADA